MYILIFFIVNLFSPSTWFKPCMVRYIWLWVERKLFLKNPHACIYPKKSCGGQNTIFFFFCLRNITQTDIGQYKTKMHLRFNLKMRKKINRLAKNIFYIVNHCLQLNYKEKNAYFMIAIYWRSQFYKLFSTVNFRGRSVVELRTHEPKVVSSNFVWTLCCVLEQGTELLSTQLQLHQYQFSNLLFTDVM